MTALARMSLPELATRVRDATRAAESALTYATGHYFATLAAEALAEVATRAEADTTAAPVWTPLPVQEDDPPASPPSAGPSGGAKVPRVPRPPRTPSPARVAAPSWRTALAGARS